MDNDLLKVIRSMSANSSLIARIPYARDVRERFGEIGYGSLRVPRVSGSQSARPMGEVQVLGEALVWVKAAV